MSHFSQKEIEFIDKADNLIINLPYLTWTSTWKYTFPQLFFNILNEYKLIYNIEFDESFQLFRKLPPDYIHQKRNTLSCSPKKLLK